MTKENSSRSDVSENDAANVEARQSMQPVKVEKYPYTAKDGKKAFYTGMIIDGKPEGEGKLLFKNGNKYKGSFENGVRKGYGRMSFGDGTIFRGIYDDDHMSSGSAKTKDGRVCTGEWYDDSKGHGTIVWPDKVSKYEGDWCKLKRDGIGCMLYPDGTKYEGEWKKDIAMGIGVILSPDGSRYEGSVGTTIEHKEALYRWGKGTQIWPDGSRYEGGWVEDAMFDYGIMYYADGSRYEGEWSLNRRLGYGIMYYADGSRYEGRWRRNRWHGEGTLYKPNGKKVHGYFYGESYKNYWVWLLLGYLEDERVQILLYILAIVVVVLLSFFIVASG